MTVILSTLQQGVLTLTFNRPEKKNALNLAMYQQLNAKLSEAEQHADIHVVLLQGSADCFTSGNDLADFLSVPELGPTHPTVEFLHRLANFPKPLVAAVSGLAIGIGTTALLHCELVYAAPGCRFQLPFTKLGLCPEAASSLLLPRLVGYQRAAQYLLLAEPFNSEQALQMGLINELVAPEALLQHAQNKAKQLAALPTEAVKISKALLKQTLPLHSDVISAELVHFQQLLQSEACQQQLQAFLSPK